MSEEWIRWEPIRGLVSQYNVDSVSNDKDLFLLLSEHKNKKIRIVFENSAFSYRVTEEKFTLATLDCLKEKYGADFYHNWSFFKINNSLYIKFLSEQSHGLADYMPLIHFVFFGSNFMVDVIATSEPKFEFINSDKK